jgi:hypothetical protein
MEREVSFIQKPTFLRKRLASRNKMPSWEVHPENGGGNRGKEPLLSCPDQSVLRNRW